MHKMVSVRTLILILVFLILVACSVPAPFAATEEPPQMIPFTDMPDEPETAGIHGVIWHEICSYTGGEAGEPLVLGQGCIEWDDDPRGFGPNGIIDTFETGWEGVTLHLGTGSCPSTGLARAASDADGNYEFVDLQPGTYCVSYDNLSDGNDLILIPGGATFPEHGETGMQQTIELSAAEDLEVNFGYAWQFYN